MTMIARISAGRQHADAERRAAEQRQLPQRLPAVAASSARTAGTSTKMPQRP